MSETDIDNLWKSIKGELEIIVNPLQFRTHIPNLNLKKIDSENNIVEFTSPSDFQRNLVEEKLYGYLKNVIDKKLGNQYRLMFTVEKKEPTKLKLNELGPLFTHEQESRSSLRNATKAAGLNDRYTFDRFIVGNHNRLAYAVLTAIADDPGKVYNPMFLYSGVGLGKTHLVQAVGHKILEKNPNIKVKYTTGEQFLNEVVDSLRAGRSGRNSINELKKIYRNLDVLIIDDIHAIAGKETTQEEFFHTFNALYMAGKQIILTSDRAPHQIKTLEERLSSRFASGMIADMQMPDIETKMAILKERNEELKLGAPDEVISNIASIYDTNIRELEAKLLQIATVAKSQGINLTTDLSNQLLGQIEKQKQARITPQVIMREVAKYYGTTVKNIKGERRTKTLVIPRQVIMYLLRDTLNMGYQSIGELLGGRDHTTIMHGVEKTLDGLTNNNQLNKELDQIKNNIKTSCL